ncbi:hypothetical protein COU17_02190 [Candidatus Kaiserbacteria bacterium CG10_big_fil_rev_8_21_14_0_10_49_17]|uniref:Uncharacterized protein n=1 Tax=Candidatus Kaiserbacteria bacterium CG10_big_fil_rev_8_21_14_0_10_49_17 TaxID=1974609 RepID=A0A2M6WE71_9BACT|nr:MAG: hypothetical protein COU17_02190 [Candidatus Kaiserbacteria bacterium CG10_big_fil_rev_8_21_14_0_10_49_17]
MKPQSSIAGAVAILFFVWLSPQTSSAQADCRAAPYTKECLTQMRRELDALKRKVSRLRAKLSRRNHLIEPTLGIYARLRSLYQNGGSARLFRENGKDRDDDPVVTFRVIDGDFIIRVHLVIRSKLGMFPFRYGNICRIKKGVRIYSEKGHYRKVHGYKCLWFDFTRNLKTTPKFISPVIDGESEHGNASQAWRAWADRQFKRFFALAEKDEKS